MTYTLTLSYLALAATLGRGLLAAAKVLPPTCDRCGTRLERRSLGEPSCCD
jgi:hypothetical protein